MSRKPENHGKKEKKSSGRRAQIPPFRAPITQSLVTQTPALGFGKRKAKPPPPPPPPEVSGPFGCSRSSQSPPGAAFTRNFPVPSPVPTSLSHSDPHGAPASAAPKRGPPLPEP